jgi:hypothetical protein
MQPFIERTRTGRRLEPVDNAVIHGAGQCDGEFGTYAGLLHETPPEIYMTYLGLDRRRITEWFHWLRHSLDRYEPLRLVPQIGLAMTHDGYPWKRYEHRVAAGEYDAAIEQLCEGLASLERPAFLRLAYEFNGEWNGYCAGPLRAAWIRIWKALRRHGLDDVALVWCYAPDAVATSDHRPFYPGDEYVDWWGIDLFSTWHFVSPKSLRFLDDAERRGFPVMIGESTPRYVGVLEGERCWREWFLPYFDTIRSRPCIRAFCYISWDWAPYPKWSDWGDCRIGENAVVLGHYRRELTKPWYRHASVACAQQKELATA